MKKFKILASALLRCMFLLAPGIMFGWWAWSKAMALIAILAAIGVETLYLLIFSFIAVVIQARSDLKHKKEEVPEPVTE